MYNVFLSLACAIILAISSVGCGNDNNNLIMATEATFPPYEYREDGKIVGLDVDIMQEVANDMGKTLVIEDMLFDSVIPAIQTRKAHVGASGISVTEDRMKQVEFSTPYIVSYQLIIIPENSNITGVDDLKGKRIGVQQGTTGDVFVTSTIQEPERFPNGALAASALAAGKIDAVVLDAEPAKNHVAKQKNLKLIEKPLMEDKYAFAVRKGDLELIEKINATIKRLEESGELATIKAKYIK